MPTDEMNQDQNQPVYRPPAWRAWLPTLAQIRYAAQLKLEWAIDGVPEVTLKGTQRLPLRSRTLLLQ